MLRDHDTHGAWCSLIPTLREEDPEQYYNFMRMWPVHFDELLERIEPFIKKTSWRKAISPGERLAITLRYLFGDQLLMVKGRPSALLLSYLCME